MANDRLFIKCKCGGGTMLAKFWAAGDWSVPAVVVERLEEFLNHHSKECLNQFGMTLDGPGYVLGTEDSQP